METTNLQIILSAQQQLLQQRASDAFRSSSMSDTIMTSEAGGDPSHEQLSMGNSYSRVVSRGDSLVPMVVVNELRSELAEMGQAYNQEVHASRAHSRELSTRHTMQTHLAMIQQHSQFNEAALNYERVAVQP